MMFQGFKYAIQLKIIDWSELSISQSLEQQKNVQTEDLPKQNDLRIDDYNSLQSKDSNKLWCYYKSLIMFDDMFDTEEDLLNGQQGGQVQSSWERQPRNCAHNLNMPDLPRKLGYPIGLKNQGATCYLNSLLQILFHTPQFRQTILSLPLCVGSAQTPSDFVGKGKQSFLMGFQRLFSEMSLSDVRAVGTDYLNDSFGWKGAQHMEQQDIQEAMRIIFDTIERALFGTEYQQAVKQLFRGYTQRYKNCLTCSQQSSHEEIFYDLQLHIKNLGSLQAALVSYATPQLMHEDNRIFCEICQSKQDMLLGNRLHELPSVLVFTLNRFDFDFQKMDRVKITSKFQFDLELDLNTFLPSPQAPEHHQYELYGVLIHRGSAHGGHYISLIRDVLQESDWNKGLKQAKEQEEKIKKQKTQQQGEKKQDKSEPKDKPTVKEAVNKDLQYGWYQINDNVATAIDVSKIANQYQGSESAYILFYRRKGTVSIKDKLVVPSYFSTPILEANRKLDEQRAAYENEKQHIIVKIKGQSHKLKTSLPILQFIQLFVPVGFALVQQCEHNGLPYYPMQFINHPDIKYSAESTLESEKIVHESNWQLYEVDSPEYDPIKNVVGIDRLPFELVLVQGEATRRIICYSDENFLMLRIKIQKQLKISYEKQVLTLVTPYKQTILTDQSQNDNMPLPKLGITHCGQIIIKTLGAQQQGQAEEAKKESSTLCFLFERDDVIGLKRIYFEKAKTLKQLLNFVVASESLKENKYRFRNLNGNRLYYLDHYDKTLGELEFSEEMIKFRLQRGEIPIKGDISVKIKLQSLLYKEQVIPIEKIFDPNTILSDVKEWACSSYGLAAQMHKLYLTDWTGEPIRSLTRQKLTIFEANFGREQLICLRDIHSPIGAELVHLEVFSTPTGSPDSVDKQSLHIKIEQFKTVGELKDLLICSVQRLNGVDPECLRLREIKRDYMFGTVWRDVKKSVKAATINSNKVVYQILPKPENLKDDQIVLILKQRNPEKRIYEQSIQLVFDAGKSPSIQDLTEAVKKTVNVTQPIKVIKYVNYDFEWVQISKENIEKILKKKKNNQKGGQKKQKNSQVSKKNDGSKKKQQEKANTDSKKGENDKVQTQNKVQTNENKEPKEKKNKNKNKPEGQNLPQKSQNQQKPKQDKGKKNQANQPKQNEDSLNLRKAPILLKDGDFIGWGLVSLLEKDDLQTDQDLSLRVTKEKTVYRPNEKGGFKLNVDF